jgi:tripartite-type tricarboxylate transporter receptor subunit TctC
MIKAIAFTTLLAAALSTTPAVAQDTWPSRAILMVGGFPGGAGTDLYQRKLGEILSAEFKVPFVVENRVGAGGNIASTFVSQAAPDGYTFLMGTGGTHAINASLYPNLGFDVVEDFTRIALVGDVPNVLLINPEQHPDITTCGDLMAKLRAEPDAMSFASTGNGASGHLIGSQFIKAAQASALHVPYAGQGPAMAAVLSGEVDFIFNQSAPSIAALKSGTVRALAVSSESRLGAIPDVPTVAEACELPGFASSTWYGIFAPADLPKDIQTRMSEAVLETINTPDFKTWLDSQGITPIADGSPEAFLEVQKKDIEKWSQVVKDSGAKID